MNSKPVLLIIGHSPSKQDPNGVLDNCDSGRRLNGWLSVIDPTGAYEVVKVNLLTNEGYKQNLSTYIDNANVVVALGSEAGKELSSVGHPFSLYLPHPSGRNRKLNDKGEIDNLLKVTALRLSNYRKPTNEVPF